MVMTEMETIRPHEDSTSLLSDAEALRAGAEADGYFYFRGLLPRDEVLAVRRQITTTWQHHGFLNDDVPAEQGIVRDGLFHYENDENPHWVAYYRDVLKLRDFHALALHRNIISILEMLFDKPVLPHSRNIVMSIFPGDLRVTTPVHQDFAYIGGTEDTWTAWIPCGDCPLDLGGLAILPGSHKQGIHPKGHFSSFDTGLAVPADSVWAASDLACGDVLMFKSTTMHQGIENVTGNRIRLSMDFRYQPRSHVVRRDSMQPHQQWCTWEDIYQDWAADDPLKYYWSDWDLKYVDKQQ
ncbi:MAG: hypothetical protein CMJ49_10025 [Planctomycetaceae bacterium]|nr:hypothetical protein [Planctomycetaceae bacterium]